jgi:hypothetical protein
MECYSCHGKSGRGNGPQASTLKDDQGYRSQPRNFARGQFKGGQHPEAVYKAIVTGLNGTPMVAYGDVLLFGGDSVQDLSPYAAYYDENALETLRAYLSSQPGEEEIASMSQARRRTLSGRRAWALTQYVLSLKKEQSPLVQWLRATTDQTP